MAGVGEHVGAGRRLQGPAGVGSRVHRVHMQRSVQAGAGQPPAAGHAAAALRGPPGSSLGTGSSGSNRASIRLGGSNAGRGVGAEPAAAARPAELACKKTGRKQR